jgi:hypothetical protein
MPATLAWLYNNKDFQLPKHLEHVNNALVDVFLGKIKRLIVNMPPRHGKTELITKTFAAWWMLNKPSHEVRIVSANADLATEFGKEVRERFNFEGKSFVLKIFLLPNACTKVSCWAAWSPAASESSIAAIFKLWACKIVA